jgi:DNA topoisomerase-1
MTLEKALALMATPKKGRGSRSSILKELGAHPETQDKVEILNGPYGPYIKSGKTNVSVPEGIKVEDVTMAQAIQWLSDKAGQPKVSKSRRKK